MRCRMSWRRGWLEVGRKSLQGTQGLGLGLGSLTRDVPSHVHSHGDSKAKAQVDTEVAPKSISHHHVGHSTKTKHLRGRASEGTACPKPLLQRRAQSPP